MVKYAVYFAIFIAVVCGVYYSGYKAGASNTKIEYVTKEVEVVKYVSKEKSEIYSRPNATRSELISLLDSGKL